MTTGYPAALLSSLRQWPACVGTLFYLIGSHLLLPMPVQEQCSPVDVRSFAGPTGFQQPLHRYLASRLRHLSTSKQTA